jgi:diguanylate cyclase (GGDEF)-like protein/putative nucleotidyltransferase with HDIG domain
MTESEVICLDNRTSFGSIPWKARVLVALFGVAGSYELLLAILDVRLADYYALGLMLFLAVVTARAKIRLIAGSSLSLLTTVVLASLMMLGAKAAILVGVCGVLVQSVFPVRRMIPHHMAFNLGMITLTVSMAGIGYSWMAPGANPPLADQFAGVLVASLIYYLGNSIYVSTVVSLTGGNSVFRVWHDNFLYTAPSFFIAGGLSFAAVRLAESVHPGVLIAVVPALYLSYYSIRVYLRSLEHEKKHGAEMSELFTSTLSTLALAIDAKDRHTHGHIHRVKTYSQAIARAMKLDERQIEAVAAAALLHDIGKLAIPEHILSKKGPLTPEEMRKMRTHPQTGADIISNIKFPYPVADSILAHHERFDGHGYPNRLAGTDIPLGARIIAVADVFDAYMADRDPTEEAIQGAIEALKENAGGQFDPEIVDVWVVICREVVDRNVAPAEHESGSRSTVYTDIRRAASEIKTLETLTETVAGLTSVDGIHTFVCALLEEAIPGAVAVVLMNGRENRHESLPAGRGVSAPVVFAGTDMGTISVYRAMDNFTDDDIRLVTTVAEKISGGLHNALALEVARREATRDKLTGLGNRRALDAIRESLSNQEFSVVLADINAFKAVNDNFGHEAGDTALTRIAIHLQTAFANARLIARLGGDEFVVVSTEPLRDVRSQIRLFRKKVRWDPAHKPYLRLHFGVSCGLATTPADGSTVEQALKKADDRMYAFKTRCKHWCSAKPLPLDMEESAVTVP